MKTIIQNLDWSYLLNLLRWVIPAFFVFPFMK
jgi:hypothetical protein